MKTKTIKSSLDPEWGENKEIGPFSGVTAVEIHVMDWDRFGSNDPMGTGVLGEEAFAALANEEEWDGWVQLELPEGYEGDASEAGEIHLTLKFTKTIVPEDEVPVELSVLNLEEGEHAPRAPEDQASLFHGPFKLKMLQKLLSSVNLPFLNHDQEKKLYYFLMSSMGTLIPITALGYVSRLTSLLPDDLVPNVLSPEFKSSVVASFNKLFDIPFVSEETERKMFATAFIACKGWIRTDMSLFTWFVDSIKHLYQYRLGQGEVDPEA